MKSAHQLRVEQFMIKAGQEVPSVPTEPSKEVRILRAKLMLEEVMETIRDGLGVDVEFMGCVFSPGSAEFSIDDLSPPFSLVETIDGCCDVSVVNAGTMIACGVPMEPFLKMVDENNLAKFGPGGYRNEAGKWIKPPGHKPPDIQGLLDRLGDLEESDLGMRVSCHRLGLSTDALVQLGLITPEQETTVDLAIQEHGSPLGWKTAEFILGPGFECGVVENNEAELRVAARVVGGSWPTDHISVQMVPKTSLVIGEGCSAFVVHGP